MGTADRSRSESPRRPLFRPQPDDYPLGVVEHFVGRAAELAALTDLLRRVEQDRRAAAAVIVGDPGSGKTRLVEEIRARAAGSSVLVVHGYEPEQSVPFAAARDLLRRLAELPGDGEVIAAVIRGTNRERPDRAHRLDDVRLFEAAYRAMTQIMPVLVVIDDLQWVDSTSAALCHYLFRASRQIGGHSLFLIGAGRPSREVHAFRASLARVSGQRLLELTLGPLDEAAGLEFVAALAPGTTPSQAREVWIRATGSPFWMERLLGRGDDIDPDVLVASHLRAMSGGAGSLLALLAAAGRPLETDDIGSLLGANEATSEAAISELTEMGLISREGDAVRIVHDLIREAAARQVPPRRLARMHGLLATWLESVAGEDVRDALEALDHRQSAGMPVSGLALQVARSSNRHFLGRPGFERLAAIADTCRGPDLSCLPLRRAVAGFAAEIGAYDEALIRWTSVAQTDEVGASAGPAWLAASRAAVEVGRGDEAWAHLERARQSGQPSELLAVELETQRSVILRSLDHRAEDARVSAEQAVTLGREIASAAGGVSRMNPSALDAYLTALLALSDAALMVDDPPAMLASADELMAVAQGIDDRIHVQAMVGGALALRLAGRNVDAERRLARAWAEAHRLVLPQAILEAGSLLGNVLLSLGRIEEAAAVSRQCVALGGRVARFRPARAFSVVLPHLVEMSAGDWRVAEAGLVAAAAAETEAHHRLHAHLARAAMLARLDPRRDPRDVVREVRRAVADAAAAGCARCRGEVLRRGSEALARVGRVSRARHLARTAAAYPQPSGDRAMHLWTVWASAMLGVAIDDPDAVRKLEETITEAEAQGLALEALWARLDLATYLASRERERAIELLRKAGNDAESMGARTEARVAEQLLRSSGVRTWRRSRSRGDGVGLNILTDRELEVARLAATGASNPEIAAELFLSRKTVERHLSNALARLGLRNRVELAAIVAAEEASGVDSEG